MICAYCKKEASVSIQHKHRNGDLVTIWLCKEHGGR